MSSPRLDASFPDHGGPPAGAGELASHLTHWLLPIDPAAHAQHLPANWRDCADAGQLWAAIGRSQPVERWCLRSGYRKMRVGHLIWAYLSRRQELCAVGIVREVRSEVGAWSVIVDWDPERTDALCRNPLPRSSFQQIPMSTCRAGPATAAVLTRYWQSAER